MIRAWDVKKAKTVIKRWGSFEVNSDSEDDMPHGEAYTFLPVVSKIFCGRGVPVRVEFQLTSKKLGRAQRLDIANKFAALVLETNVEIDGSRELENYYDDLTRFPEEVTRIRIQRNRFRSRVLWTVPRAAFLPRLHAQLVQHRIDEKNNRSAVYREKSSQVWFVMVHSLHFSLASTFENSREALEHNYCSYFDRTFLLNLFDKQSHELTTYGTP